ncbi:hypothetical protein Ga0609869_002672 [Rhodovulum iodosum]|uniref:DUF1223 domain-containing protein n=1 Tax=Rhodovulum iodosum TaxID=68291 RepID=A0ABV3XWA8_9RHOB|nr:DUF1223 domain-containing protein [Rhodovulum robiginosum]RSK33505.1 DUF1223 domain-containing protein [Rhodovulum robiginosum]
MPRIVRAVTLIWIALYGVAQAEDRPVIIELFTSQGCSSCPPVDAMVAELAKRDDVIPLALHVDYWDYIGWKDVFAQPGFTRRQKAYARAAHTRSIYTPQIVVGGVDHVVGYRPMDVAQLIEAHRDAASPVSLSIVRDGDDVVITANSTETFAEDAVLQVVRYIPERVVDIGRGENAGRTLRYTNIVDAWKAVARWDGAAPLVVTLEADGEHPVVAIVQKSGPGQILAAARVR